MYLSKVTNMKLLKRYELLAREMRAVLGLTGLALVSALAGYAMNFEPLLGMYFGMLGYGLLLTAMIIIPLNNCSRWIDAAGVPDWLQETAFLILFIGATVFGAVVTASLLNKFF